MLIKYIVLCYVQHWGYDPYIRKEVEFLNEPTHEQIEKTLSEVELYDSDYEIDYNSGARLPDDMMPKKSKIRGIYAVVEKRYYKDLGERG